MTYIEALKKFNYSGRRTLRTIFDYLSHEWTNTLLSEKMTILKDIITEEQSLTVFLEQYFSFYSNKEYVVRAIPESLELVYNKSEDPKFKGLLFQQYLYFLLNSKLHIKYKLDLPLFIKKREEYKDIEWLIGDLDVEDIIFIKKQNQHEFYNRIAKKYYKEKLSLKLLNKLKKQLSW